jgi:hypothetical protein
MSWSGFSKVLLLLSVVCAPALGATDPLAEGIRRCAAQADQIQRLACFDALASSLPELEADKLGMTPDIERRRDTARQKELASGSGHIEQNAAAAAAKQQAGADNVTAKILSVRENARGLLIFSLDNNQVWVQDQPSPSISFAAGETVHIEHGAMSSLWLAAGHGRKTRVKRVS